MSKFANFFADVRRFHSQHRAVSAMVWLFSVLLVAVPSLPWRLNELPAFLVYCGTTAAFVFHMLNKYARALDARIAAGNAGPVWQVQINGVTVGELADSDYASIRRAVFLDGRTYGAQLMNLANVALRMVNYLYLALPLAAFWLALGAFFFAPDSFAEAIDAIQKITPAQAVAAIPMLAQLLVIVSVLTLGLHFAIGRHFGFVNQFDNACGSRVRRAVSCAADGNVSLFRIEDCAYVLPDELATVRLPKAR